jgi:very-short-patch-repair endonuclease
MDPRKAKTFSNYNRKNLTPAEASLWKLIKGKQLQGRKFRRQHCLGNYLVDFYCFSEKLIIELDGPIHSGQKVHDEKRQAYLESLGMTVLRFKNHQVFEEQEEMLKTIQANFKKE